MNSSAAAWSMEEVARFGRAPAGWRFATWNPTTGCTKVSPACDHCYAERIALRMQREGHPRYRNGFRLTLHPDRMEEPLRWRRPHVIFVCSMSDLFHADVPDSYLERIFAVMRQARWHCFQVLTKRIRRAARMAERIDWPPNVWMGTTVEMRPYCWRIRWLCRIPAPVRFLSLEPLLGPIPDLPLEGIDWVLVGGESGPRARPCRPEWVRAIRDRCRRAGVAFYFKQWGGPAPSRGGRRLDGRTYEEMPPLPAAEEEQLALFPR